MSVIDLPDPSGFVPGQFQAVDYPTGETSPDRTNDETLISKLTQDAKRFRVVEPWKWKYQIDGKSGNLDYLLLDSRFSKLFEAERFEGISITQAKAALYHVGWCDFFKCPTIILQDTKGRTVDIIRYRPTSPDGRSLPKYLQKKTIDKPQGRGEHWHFPFANEMMGLAECEGFAFIGEGIKNALNALFHGVPFISVESASGAANQTIVQIAKELFSTGIEILAAFDGDEAGRKAHITFEQVSGITAPNVIPDGQDFTTWRAAQ